jgi:hypothetical protein
MMEMWLESKELSFDWSSEFGSAVLGSVALTSERDTEKLKSE